MVLKLRLFYQRQRLGLLSMVTLPTDEEIQAQMEKIKAPTNEEVQAGLNKTWNKVQQFAKRKRNSYYTRYYTGYQTSSDQIRPRPATSDQFRSDCDAKYYSVGSINAQLQRLACICGAIVDVLDSSEEDDEPLSTETPNGLQ